MDTQEMAPTRLHELTALIVARLGTVGRTKLTKLLYLLDLAHFSRYGSTLSGGTWIRWTLGPMLRDLPRVTKDMAGHELTCKEWRDERGYDHADYATSSTGWRFQPSLRDHEQALLNETLERYGSLSRDEIIKAAYASAPMRLVQQWEAGASTLMGTEIPFYRALGSPEGGLDRYRRIADAVREPYRGLRADRERLEDDIVGAFAPLRAEALTSETADTPTP